MRRETGSRLLPLNARVNVVRRVVITLFVEGELWIVRTGSAWRDLPEVFGDWNSVFRRFSRWSAKGVRWRMLDAMSDDPDFEYLIIDSTVVRAYQHAAGAKKRGPEDQAIGRSRGGLSTKIHMAGRGIGCLSVLRSPPEIAATLPRPVH